jgi:hypothetical protein
MKVTSLVQRSVAGLGALILVAVAGTSAAQEYQGQVNQGPGGYEQRNRGEVGQDRREIWQDRTAYRSDWQEVRRLSRLMARLDDAQQQRDRYQERRLREGIHMMLRQEIAEARMDLERDRREMWRSARESQGNGSGPGAWDDRRDLRDDRMDRMAGARRLMRLNRISQRLDVIDPAVRSHDNVAMHEEDRLLSSFMRLVRDDAIGSGRELREDRQELQEDRGPRGNS